jgi:hypothetical protein
MALIDDIEFYGRSVDAGEMPRQQAAVLLAGASGGGLTVDGAAQLVDNWTTVRSRYESVFRDAKLLLDCLKRIAPDD